MFKQKALERKDKKEKREERAPTLAELTLNEMELRRLRKIGIETRKKLKIGKAGITEGIVNGIHERWRHSEVVKIVCEDLCRKNMKRTHDLLEVRSSFFNGIVLVLNFNCVYVALSGFGHFMYVLSACLDNLEYLIIIMYIAVKWSINNSDMVWVKIFYWVLGNER